MFEDTKNRKLTFEQLETDIIESYILSQKETENSSLLNMVEIRGGKIIEFNSVFDKTYAGGTIRQKYMSYMEDLRRAA